MTSKVEEKKEIFNQTKDKYIDIYEQEDGLDSRMSQAEENIVNLQ